MTDPGLLRRARPRGGDTEDEHDAADLTLTIRVAVILTERGAQHAFADEVLMWRAVAASDRLRACPILKRMAARTLLRLNAPTSPGRRTTGSIRRETSSRRAEYTNRRTRIITTD